MSHDHGAHAHHHHHAELQRVNLALLIGISLNTAFVVIEIFVGLHISSLALISDAGHNATDVIALLLSLFAFRMLQVKATEKYSYGYKKLSILVSLANAIFLIITVGLIFYEGIRRLDHPVAVAGKTVSLVAVAGIFVNGISALFFFRNRKDDINIRGAYLHLLSDAIASAGVVIAGIVIYFTHWFWLDSVVSLAIGVIILLATIRLLNDSVRLALDGTPTDIDMLEVKNLVTNFPGVVNMHHLHIWPISSKENAMTAHLLINKNSLAGFERSRHELKHALLHLNIHHVTFETETEPCENDDCGVIADD